MVNKGLCLQVLLSFLLLIQPFAITWAQYQQPLPLYAPEHLKYRLSQDPTRVNEDLSKAGVLMEWDINPEIEKWIVVLAKDEDFQHIISVDYALQNYAFSPYLEAGTYYFKAYGLREKAVVFETEPKKLNVEAKDFSKLLKAPVERASTHMELYPPKARFRLAWTPVEGAGAYRFQIFERRKMLENIQKGKLPQARWVTEVKEPWIEISDVPYSSFNYLDVGFYYWDVAGIDAKTRKTGVPLYSMFEVDHNYYLGGKSLRVNFSTIWIPALHTASDSATSGEHFKISSPSYRVRGAFDWWLARHWGWSSEFGVKSLEAEPAGTFFTPRIATEGLFRIYLSKGDDGTTLILRAGVIIDGFLEINRMEKPTRTERPYLLGPRIGATLRKEWSEKWTLDLAGAFWTNIYAINVQDPVYTQRSGIDKNFARISSSASLSLRFQLMPSLSIFGGVLIEKTALAYQPRLMVNSTELSSSGFGGFIGVEKLMPYR